VLFRSLADTAQSYDDTEAQMNADIKFFDAAKASCSSKSAEWKTRSDLRTEEFRGIAEALRILTSDDARELFNSSIKAGKETSMVEGYDTGMDITASFIQVRQQPDAPNGAYGALKAAAAKTHSLRLAMLAAQVHEMKVGHFDKVIKAIDTMMVTLKDEDVADIAKRDQCTDEYKNIASTVANANWLIKNNDAKIDKLVAMIEARTAEKVKTRENIEEVKAQIAAITAQRKEANAEFKHKKAEDQAAIALLMEARAALSAYYGNNSIALGPIQGEVNGVALVSGPVFEVSADQAPDAVFSGQDKRKNEAKGIVQIMTMLIEDVNDEIKNGMRDEEAAQLEYEGMLKAAQNLQAKLETQEANLIQMIADHGEEKSDEHQLKLENLADLKDEQDYKARITPDCDWILKAFAERSEKRAAELEGLTRAKEFLAESAKAPSLVEKKGAARRVDFDDSAFSLLSFAGLRR